MMLSEFFQHCFSFLCGQNPAHTWTPGGLLLPFCQRCTGLYVGAAVAALLHGGLRPPVTARFLWAHGLLFLAAAPFCCHWLPQGPGLRTCSGVLFGFGVVACLRAPLRQLWTRPDIEQTSGKLHWALVRRNWAYAAGLLTTLLGLPLLAERGGVMVAGLLTAVAFLGALVLGLLVLAVLGVCLASALQWTRSRTRSGVSS